MALTPQLVRKICDVVNADAECRSVISDPFKSPLLEQLGLAGSARNLGLIAGDIIPPLATRSINEMFGLKPDNTRLLCLGITVATQAAILKNRAVLPEVAACAAVSRVHWGTHHTATWVRLKDDGEYVFDWHATLNIFNPLLSRAADWPEARGAVLAIHFGGFL